MQLTQINVERIEPSLIALDVEISQEDVEQALRSVYRDLQQRTNVPGFRKGKVPDHILKRQVGSERIRREVIDRLVLPAYEQALKDQSLEPLEQANVETIEFDERSPLRFKARVLVKPEVTLGEYKGVAALKPKVAVTDENVEEQLTALRESRAELEDVQERGVQNGDVVTAELEVYVEGELYKEGRQSLTPFVVGESRFVPPIDDHLLGAKAGEERRFSVSYPSDFDDADLADKNAEFHIYVVSVKEKRFPELNDEFAKTVGENLNLNNLESLRQHIRQRLTELKESQASDQVRQRVLEAVVSQASVDVPERLVHRRADRKWQQLEEELKQRHLALEDFIEYRKMTPDELRAELRAEAELEIKREFVLEAVAKLEGLTALPEDVESEVNSLAVRLKQEPDELRQQMTANGMMRALESSMRDRKTIDWLVDAAQVTEEEQSMVNG